MVNLGAPCTTAGCNCGLAATAISPLPRSRSAILRPASRTFHDQSVGENGPKRVGVRVANHRLPASLTKMLTFARWSKRPETGRLNPATPLPVSSRAAMQNPTKLGLKANQTIKAEDAIKGLVTRSANDAAVVIAEAIAGSEEEFAKLMTLKARALGMTSTTYINASGLPAGEQITTARDQAVLGRAIQHRFPGYYQYFATLSFRYKGAEMHNHNALLGQVKGVDGIKTGYTEAS